MLLDDLAAQAAYHVEDHRRNARLHAAQHAADVDIVAESLVAHGDDGDDWGGVAAFRTFQQACALLPEQGSDAVCSAVYGQLLHPDGAKAHLPEIIAVMEPLAQDPTDASARLRLYELRDLLQEDA